MRIRNGGIHIEKGNLLYEIEWRNLLLKRLKTSRSVLNRDATKEGKERAEAKQLATGYCSFEEAHEAYGWAYITEKQLDAIRVVFENQENISKMALIRMNQIIGSLEGEIKMLYNDEGYREEILANTNP